MWALSTGHRSFLPLPKQGPYSLPLPVSPQDCCYTLLPSTLQHSRREWEWEVRCTDLERLTSGWEGLKCNVPQKQQAWQWKSVGQPRGSLWLREGVVERGEKLSTGGRERNQGWEMESSYSKDHFLSVSPSIQQMVDFTVGLLNSAWIAT